MRRPLFVVLVLGGTFAGLLLLIMGLSVVPVTAVSADLPEAVVPEDIQVGTALTLTVNYAHDWVAGSTIGDATVAVTVTDNGGSVKATATITADVDGYFEVNCEHWDGECPDIQSGDRVFAATDGVTASIDPIGTIIGDLDADADTVSGTLYAESFSGSLEVQCGVWENPGHPDLIVSADPKGGSYLCEFESVGWELMVGQQVAVMYYEPDGDRIINLLNWPRISARIGPNSDSNREVWGNGAGSNATVAVSVTTSSDTLVDSVETQADIDGNFNTDSRLAFDSLAINNWVFVDFGNGVTDTMIIHDFVGVANVGTDVVTVTLPAGHTVSPSATVNLEFCHPDGGCDGIPMGEFGTGTSKSIDLKATAGFDIRPGSSFEALLDDTQQHDLTYAWSVPAPNVNIDKWNPGNHARPGGPMVYSIGYGNDGDGVADNVVISDTLPSNLTYFGDTSGFTHDLSTAGFVVWNLGTLDPWETGAFAVTFLVADDAQHEDTIPDNCVEINTSSDGDWDGDNQRCTEPVNVFNDHVEVSVDKWPVINDPTPGQEFGYAIQWCNHRGAAAGPVWMTDTLPSSTTLVGWQQGSNDAGFWVEVSANDEQLVLYAPSLPGQRCEEINLHLMLNQDVALGTRLVNEVVIFVEDNQQVDNSRRVNDDAVVGPARNDLALEKSIHSSVPTPGGWFNYFIHYENRGNITATVTITDIVPEGLAYESANWGGDQPQENEPFPNPTIDGDLLTWELGEIAVGGQAWFHIQMSIDDDLFQGFEVENCAAIYTEAPDSTPDNNHSCVSTTLNPRGPNLMVTKESWWHDEGGSLEYQITFANIGNDPVQNVLITDTFPVGTLAAGEPWWDFHRHIELTDNTGNSQWLFQVEELQSGDQGHIGFSVNLDDPLNRPQWYTNTVEIDVPVGDTKPANNFYDDVAFTGGEVSQVEFWLNTDGNSNMSGNAIPGVPLTVTTEHGTFVTNVGNDGCDTCWNIEDSGIIEPGDQVVVAAGAGIIPVTVDIPDPFTAAVDSGQDQVSGQIGGWNEQRVDVNGNWSGGYQEITSEADGSYLAEYDDIPRGASGEVQIWTQVNYADVSIRRPFISQDLVMRVNYGHDWVEGNYESGHTIWITVTDSTSQTVKATAELTSGFWCGGDEPCFSTEQDDWQGQRPDIVTGDWVFGLVDNGFNTKVRVGDIAGEVDVEADTVSGTITAVRYSEMLNGQCGVWVEDGPEQISFMVDPQSGEYLCDFKNVGWDLQPGQSVGVEYQDPDGNSVINVFEEPSPYLRIQKGSGNQPAEGSNFMFHITYQNDGGAAAEDVVITETLMGGMTYLSDTSGTDPSGGGSGPIVWELGTVEAGAWYHFHVFVEITGSNGDPISNTVEIATSNPFDQGDPGEKYSQWDGQIVANDTSLNIGKDSWTGDPAPGYDFVYEINPCNNGSTDSSRVVITDTLHVSTTVKSWWSPFDMWQEISRSDHEIVFSSPSMDGYACRQIYLEATVIDQAEPGTYISNTVVIWADNDLDGENNESGWEGQVGEERVDLVIDKSWNWGELVPGGEIVYNVNFQNHGNIPVGTVRITDTLPTNTTFVTSWENNDWGSFDFDPIVVTADYVVWEIDSLDNGVNYNIDVMLAVDDDADPGTILTNTIEISPQPSEDNLGDNFSVWVEELNDNGPNIRVRKNGQWHDCCEDVRSAHYSVVIENIGDQGVGDIVVTDAYPAEMVLDDVNFDGPFNNWGDDPASHTFTATIDWLDPATIAWIDFDASVPGDGPLDFGLVYTNTAWVDPISGDTNPSDDTDQAILNTGPDLWVVKTLVDGDALPGELITFTLAFGNDRYGHEWWWNTQGTAWLTDTLPTGLEFVQSEFANCADSCEFTPTFQDETTVVWELWPLSSGEWHEILLTVRITDTVDGDDILTNWAEIGTDQPAIDLEPNYHNNVDSFDVPIALPKFEISKEYASNKTAGVEVTYTLAFSNVGNVAGTGLVITDMLPSNVTWISGGDDYDAGTKIISWDWPSLAAGASGTVQFVGELDCSGDVDNDTYRVATSNEGVSSPWGDAVGFTILKPVITAAFNQSAGEVQVDETVVFTDTSVTNGGDLVSWMWDFGDSETGSGNVASHAYSDPGTYALKLTVTDGCGNSDTESVPGAVTVSVSEHLIYLPFIIRQ